MSKMSEIDIEVRELISQGFTANQIHVIVNLPIEMIDNAYQEEPEEE